MSATMAERVGTCILNELERHNCLPGSDLGERGSIAFDMAMTVLEAMRHPTKAMWEAGDKETFPPSEDVWNAMIDAALAEHNTPTPSPSHE